MSGHAYSTMKEMTQAAEEKGLKGLAITDHAPDMPGSTNIFYFQNLQVVPRKRGAIELLLGSELNIRNEAGEVDLPESVLKSLDITIASIHRPCYKGEAEKDRITKAYLRAMENPYIDIIGHPDDGRYPVDYEELVKKAKETGTLLEVNNSSLRPGGFRENARDNILEMLGYCKKYEAMVVLNTDAHVDAAIADCSCIEELLEETDFPKELIANLTLKRLKASLKRTKK